MTTNPNVVSTRSIAIAAIVAVALGAVLIAKPAAARSGSRGHDRAARPGRRNEGGAERPRPTDPTRAAATALRSRPVRSRRALRPAHPGRRQAVPEEPRAQGRRRRRPPDPSRAAARDGLVRSPHRDRTAPARHAHAAGGDAGTPGDSAGDRPAAGHDIRAARSACAGHGARDASGRPRHRMGRAARDRPPRRRPRRRVRPDALGPRTPAASTRGSRRARARLTRSGHRIRRPRARRPSATAQTGTGGNARSHPGRSRPGRRPPRRVRVARCRHRPGVVVSAPAAPRSTEGEPWAEHRTHPRTCGGAHWGRRRRRRRPTSRSASDAPPRRGPRGASPACRRCRAGGASPPPPAARTAPPAAPPAAASRSEAPGPDVCGCTS